jgi:hypothetical protein
LSDFEFLDVVHLPGLELFRAGLVPKEERKEPQEGQYQGEQQLKVQLFFYSCRVEKKVLEIIGQEEIKKIRPLLGEKTLVKFKVGEEVFKRCQQLGLLPGSKCDWDALPQPWMYKDSQGRPKLGVWYQPAALLKLNGRDINYQILQAKSKPQQQDAFAYFGNPQNSNNTHSTWEASLGNLEKEINAELEHA